MCGETSTAFYGRPQMHDCVRVEFHRVFQFVNLFMM